MKYLIIITFSLILSTITYSQDAKRLTHNIDTNLIRTVFLRDSTNNEIRLFGMGGYTPTAYTKKDSSFEKNHKIKYVLFGCEPKYEIIEMIEYNRYVATYLDRIFGTDWRKEIHRDVIGL